MRSSSLTALALAFALVACKDKAGDDTGGLTGDPDAGAEVFSSTCAVCHGADGSGIEGSGSDLNEEVPEFSDAELENIIQNGYEEMPPQGLTDQELADVIAYLRETFGEHEG